MESIPPIPPIHDSRLVSSSIPIARIPRHSEAIGPTGPCNIKTFSVERRASSVQGPIEPPVTRYKYKVSSTSTFGSFPACEAKSVRGTWYRVRGTEYLKEYLNEYSTTE